MFFDLVLSIDNSSSAKGQEMVGMDESMLTGESRVVPKYENSLIYGGTIVVEGSCLLYVTACGDESALGRIVATVQDAQSSKPPIQEVLL